jgi:lipooligosaccharide transport system permease protein
VSTVVDTNRASSGVAPCGRWRSATEYWFAQYRRNWRGTLTSSVLAPVLYLLAMGVGLGTYVHHGTGRVDGVRYVQFLAPGLLAANAMTTAFEDATWPVLGAIKWFKTYPAMLATPLTVDDVLVGHLVFMALRVAFTSAIFSLVIVAFGDGHTATGVLLSFAASVLTGIAFAGVVAAYTSFLERDVGLALLYRFALVPLFLFSGTFFPVSQLPAGLRPVAWVTPLWHGVSLCRNLALGQGSAVADLGHVGYLVGFLLVGVAIARVSFRRRLRW